MIDFASAAYLGFHHRREELASWSSLTLGKPPALAESSAARLLARQMKQLVGLPDALLGSSTLHLFWDLFQVLHEREPSRFLAEDTLYPVARWGLERGRQSVQRFRSQDPEHLAQLLALPSAKRPVVVCDGWSPSKGKAAPLRQYQRLVQAAGGCLVVDDTQAVGILGEAPNATEPWGRGGKSSVGYHGLEPDNLIWVASLAKAFSAPLAAMLGPRELLETFRERALTRLHCSGPSESSIAAGLSALQRNSTEGAQRRQALAKSVNSLRDGFRRLAIPVAGGFFPYLTALVDDAEAAHGHLKRHGIWTVLHRQPKSPLPCLSFLCRADQSPAGITQTIEALDAWQNRNRSKYYARRNGR